MPPYAEIAHVKARAGPLARAWGEDTEPSDADLGVFLANIASEIDGALVGLGFSLPVGDTSSSALTGMNADGALLLALDATWPAGEGPSAATALAAAVRARYDRSWELLLAGRHPASIAIEIESDPALAATDFWQENEDYGLAGSEWFPPARDPNPALDPHVLRGMTL